MQLADRFAETSVKGALTRAAVAWVLITPAVAAAKIWWSGTAAFVVFLVGVTIYIVVAVRYRQPPSATVVNKPSDCGSTPRDASSTPPTARP